METITCPDCTGSIPVDADVCETCGRMAPRVRIRVPIAPRPTNPESAATGVSPRSTTAFPLLLTFKTFAMAPQLAVTDAGGNLLLYVRQKLFAFKERVTVFADREQQRPLYTISADRVLDFSAQYTFRNMQGMELGAIRRKGMRSFWRANYEVVREGRVVMTIQEENPWAKVADGLLGEIPVLGLLTGLLFHPAYRVERAGGGGVMRIEKEAALLEGRFRIEAMAGGAAHAAEEGLIVLSLLMLVLLERRRG